MVRVLSEGDVADCLALPDLLSVVADAFVADAAGRVERPDRPHFPVGGRAGGREGPGGTALAMPAHVHGSPYFATKVASVHGGNADPLPTVNAQVLLARADTGLPVALLAGRRLTNARTGCVGGLAARELADPPVTLGLLGAGAQARWQARAVAAAVDLSSVAVYSPNSRAAFADDLGAELAADVRAVDTPGAAVAGANVVVTATTSSEPVFDGDDLAPGALVVAVGAYTPDARELDARTFERAAAVFADVPGEVADIGDLQDTGLDAGDLVPFGDVLAGDAGRTSPHDILVVESVGSAVLDAAAADHVYERAREHGAGACVTLDDAADDPAP